MLRKRLSGVAILVVLGLLALPSSASAFDPEQVVGGTGSEWFSGSLIQQTGSNCSVLGSAYTEVMVSGVGGYGGAPGGGIPNVGEPYWASFLVSIPGNPCGSGSSAVATDLALPPNTRIDGSRNVRCFGQPRGQNTFTQELTGASWSFLGSSGQYCNNNISGSPRPGAVRVGFRPLANGQLFQIFVPVISDAPVSGGVLDWLTEATGVYTNPGLSRTFAYVFQSGGGGNPRVYFERDPAAIPFWVNDASLAGPPDLRNRAEFFANAYTAGLAGNFCFKIERFVPSYLLIAECADDPGFDGSVPAGLDFVRVNPSPDVTGPNGGYAPFAFVGPDSTPNLWNTDLRITWTFTPTSFGSPVSASEDFRTLSGPDEDGDGVATTADACPQVKGTLANGCLPAVQADPDRDGIYGAADKCPDKDGLGSLDGCPKGGPLVTPPPLVVSKLIAGVGVKKGARLKRRRLAKGQRIKLTCSVDSNVTAALRITRKVAKRLRLKARKIGSGKASCTKVNGGSLKLKLTRKAARALRRRKVAAKLTFVFKPAVGASQTIRLAIKII